ncbi:MAG TPA: hypothetical protein PLO89_04390 [Spirochaetota bacterium]|nr:hypothetical protein [Spirochaetota bacterium]
MKKIFVFVSIVLLIGCSVNENTGLITIKNSSSVSINLTLGNTKYYVPAGGKYDCWFYQSFSGKINGNYELSLPYVASGYDDASGDVIYKNKEEAGFKTGYKYNVDVFGVWVNTGNYPSYETAQIIYAREGIKIGANVLVDGDGIHYPGNL